jgi:hypothetical protein
MKQMKNKTKKIMRNTRIRRRQRGGHDSTKTIEEPLIIDSKEVSIQILNENKIIDNKIAEIETKIKENDDKKYYDKKYYEEFKKSFELLKSKYKNKEKNDDNLIIKLNHILQNISKEIYSCNNIKIQDSINKGNNKSDILIDELLKKCDKQDNFEIEDNDDIDNKIDNFGNTSSSNLRINDINVNIPNQDVKIPPQAAGIKRTKRTRGKKAGKRSTKTAKKMRS